jgi:hypothetical protein
MIFTLKKTHLITFIVMMLFPTEAYLSQIHYREVSIEDIVKYSGEIVIATPAKPFSTEKIIPIHEDQKKYPPYHQITQHYKIIGILSDKSGTLKNGQEINVDPTTASNDFESHKMYYLTGFSESPIVYAYRREGRVSNNLEEGNHILFLNGPTSENLFRFTNDFSYEDETMKDQIIKLIKEIKKTD